MLGKARVGRERSGRKGIGVWCGGSDEAGKTVSGVALERQLASIYVAPDSANLV